MTKRKRMKPVKADDVFDECRTVMRLIANGLDSGSISAKPVVDFTPRAESCDIEPLSAIVNRLLLKIERLHNARVEIREVAK